MKPESTEAGAAGPEALLPCLSCGTPMARDARFCAACGTPAGETGRPKPGRLNFQTASDNITSRLGLERIEAFSLQGFFSQVLRKHDPDAVEELFSVGTKATTPPLHESMGHLPSPWVFFRVLAGALLTYLVFYLAWAEFRNLNLVPGLIMVGSFAVPTAVVILFFELNTPRNVSITRIIQMVMAGGALALLFSLVIFEATPVLGRWFGASSAGIVEECAKLLAVLAVLRWVPVDRYPYKLNGLLFGAAVGAGFAAFESAGYALRFGLRNTEAMLDIIMLRGALSPFGHIAWTAIAACAYLSTRRDHPDFRSTLRDRRFYLLFGTAVILHFAWNLPFQGPFMLKFWVLGFVAWVVIISLVQSGLREVRESCATPS